VSYSKEKAEYILDGIRKGIAKGYRLRQCLSRLSFKDDAYRGKPCGCALVVSALGHGLIDVDQSYVQAGEALGLATQERVDFAAGFDCPSGGVGSAENWFNFGKRLSKNCLRRCTNEVVK